VKAVRNTVNYWCFQNMARDLYGFRDEYLDEGNCDWLFDAVAEKIEDTSWEVRVLDAARVERVSAAREATPRLADRYFPYEYGEYLICPGHSADPVACFTRVGESIQSAADLAAGIRERIQQLVKDYGVRALHIWIPLTFTYRRYEEGQVQAAFTKQLSRASVTVAEQDQLTSFTADRAAEVCGEVGLPIQLFFGSIPVEAGGPQVSLYRPEWLRALVPFFSKHSGTNFDLFLATRVISHEATVLARNYPNLWVSGAWWQAFTPSTLSIFYRDRLEMLPMNRWNAFYSDAYCAEWVYGKSTLVRNRLALALSEMLEEGLLSRGMVEEMVSSLLRDNALRLYLGQSGQVC
jgi:glucuronate isomerase